eukprot:3431342-Rhodomonas_salina.1
MWPKVACKLRDITWNGLPSPGIELKSPGIELKSTCADFQVADSSSVLTVTCLDWDFADAHDLIGKFEVPESFWTGP